MTLKIDSKVARGLGRIAPGHEVKYIAFSTHHGDAAPLISEKACQFLRRAVVNYAACRNRRPALGARRCSADLGAAVATSAASASSAAAGTGTARSGCSRMHE